MHHKIKPLSWRKIRKHSYMAVIPRQPSMYILYDIPTQTYALWWGSNKLQDYLDLATAKEEATRNYTDLVAGYYIDGE